MDFWKKFRLEEARKARKLFPKTHQGYELFDCSVFVAVIIYVGYLVEGPGDSQTQTLGLLEEFASLETWGTLLFFCAVTGIVFSYFPKLIRYGYGLMVAGCVFWCLMFVVGLLVFDGSYRSISSALIYAWVARRLITEGGGR